jgi:adenylate kinase family enzyme
MPSNESALILTGPPGAGKTTVGALVARRYELAVHLEADHFFHFIAAGGIEPWRPEAHEQNERVMRIVGEAAAGYARAGYFTIIDGILIPGWFYEPVRDRLAASDVDVSYAILRPPLEACIARAGGRPDRPLRERAVMDQLWMSFANLGQLERHVIDDERLGSEDTADLVFDRLRSGQLSV